MGTTICAEFREILSSVEAQLLLVSYVTCIFRTIYFYFQVGSKRVRIDPSGQSLLFILSEWDLFGSFFLQYI